MSRRGWLIALGVALVIALGAGAVWIWQSSTRPASADDTATTYLRALESGDSAAVEATGIDVTPEALAAFDDATTTIDDAIVTSVEQTARAAIARVSFTLDGEKHEAEISLTLTDGIWTVDASSLGILAAKSSLGTAIAIGATTFSASEDIAVIPAVYTLAAAPADLLDGSAEVAALPGERSEISLDATLRPEATAAAQLVLDEHLEACASSDEVAPEGCGIRIPWGTEFRAVSAASYRIETMPTIVLNESGFSADGGVIVATVSGTGQDGAARTTTYRTDSWSVRGDVTFTEGGIELETW